MPGSRTNVTPIAKGGKETIGVGEFTGPKDFDKLNMSGGSNVKVVKGNGNSK